MKTVYIYEDEYWPVIEMLDNRIFTSDIEVILTEEEYALIKKANEDWNKAQYFLKQIYKECGGI